MNSSDVAEAEELSDTADHADSAAIPLWVSSVSRSIAQELK